MQMMLERLRDKQPAIRCQAALALARLADPGEEGDFVGDSVTDSYIKLLGTEKNKVTGTVPIVTQSGQNAVNGRYGAIAHCSSVLLDLFREQIVRVQPMQPGWLMNNIAFWHSKKSYPYRPSKDLICRTSEKPCCTPCLLRPAACQTSWTGPETSTMRWAPLIQLQQGLSGSQHHAITSAQQALLLCMCSAVGMSVGKDPCSVLTHAT